jgi:Skp family chaperone for outer membrane proteins
MQQMKPLTKRISLVTALIALGGTVAMVCQAGASRIMSAQPSVVVTVNLSAVLEKLDQRAQAAVSLKAMTDAFKAEDDRRKAEITELGNQLNAMQEQTEDPKRAELQEITAGKLLEYQAWLRFATSKSDLEEALVMKDLYRTIKDAVKALADAEGYDIVMVDDSQGELSTTDDSKMPRAVQIKQQIVARRTLFVSPRVDITDHLITRMNNAYKAGPTAAAPQ